MSNKLQLEHRFYSLGPEFSASVNPAGMTNPTWVKRNHALANDLGLTAKTLQSDYYLDVFSGKQILPGTYPIAQAYAGHQFGKFNPFLGDGRSILLGELVQQDKLWEISLKGAGKTPFTFVADGMAGLKECLHEYTIYEQLAEQGISTVRCLSLIQGAEQVYRNGFEPRSVLCRVAPTFIRFGTFEACYFKRNFKALQVLADYVIQYYYPDILRHYSSKEQQYSEFFRQVVERTAELIAAWQNCGFVHGMMNTDNLSIVGITLDVGESSFIDKVDGGFVASTRDEKGRYAFANQPVAGLWGCNVLAKTLSPIIPAKQLKQGLQSFESTLLKIVNN